MQSFLYSQTQDLFSLASGDFIGFNALFDQKDNLYGYISLYSYGKSGEKTKKFEYVLLDKNLNPVARKEFQGDLIIGTFFGYIDLDNKIVLAPSSIDALQVNFWKLGQTVAPSSMVIDPKTNTITRKVYYDYENGTFTEVTQRKNFKEERKESKAERKAKGYNYFSNVSEIKQGGYLGIEYHVYPTYVNNNSLIRFDENRKELWRFKYNTSGDNRVSESLYIIDKDDKNIYTIVEDINNKVKTYDLLVLDIKTGKTVSNKRITGLTDETISTIISFYANGSKVSNSKSFDHKNIRIGYNFIDKKDLGFTRFILDKDNFNIDTKAINYKPDFEPYLKKISKNGDVGGGYYLLTKDFFLFEDGSTGILMEKYKPEGSYNAPKTTDIVFAYTDKDFKVKGIDVYEKEKSKWANNDYLFSQYLNEGKDLVFFYKDYAKNAETREKNWTLFINTIIDGKFKQEKIPITEKGNFEIAPYVAKEGYILLREFNEKEKFNKIRLERLNY